MIPGRFSIRRMKLYLKTRQLKGKEKRLLIRKIKIKRVVNYKRLTPRKVFVGKGSIKHTSNKVTVTLYTYSLLKIFLLRKIKRLIHYLYFPQKTLVLFITKDFLDPAKKRRLISYNRPLSLEEFLYSPTFNRIIESRTREISTNKKKKAKAKAKHPIKYHEEKKIPSYLITFYEAYLSFNISSVKRVTRRLRIMVQYYQFLSKLVQDKVLYNEQKIAIFTGIATKFKYSQYNKRFFFSLYKARKVYLARLLRFSWALYVNNLKFKNPTLVSKLKALVRNLYGKKVEFNVVELKKMHLSSDIFTQAVSLKLRNRDNRLFKVLKTSLTRVDLPNVSRLTERFSTFIKEEYLINKVRNTTISSMFSALTSMQSNLNNNVTPTLNNTKDTLINSSNDSSIKDPTALNKTNDSLNNLLSGFFPPARNMVDMIKGRYSRTSLPISINDYVLKNLKHRHLAGVRLEAKGRLTRRFKAQRSIFKLTYKGGLRNVDSSFKGLSAVMLRGMANSNVQYSAISSKNRVGAYGIKG